MRSSSSPAEGNASIRSYERETAAVFRKTHERFGGLSNMAAGYPLVVNGTRIRTSEALYQACRFPHLPDVQRAIITEGSPMTAKMKSKPYRSQSRADWDRVRVKIMRWALRVKLVQNFTRFSEELLETGDLPIVEESRKDDFWGAKVSADGSLVGANVLGRLLMELRDEVRAQRFTSSVIVPPVEISDFLLLGQPIGPLAGVPHRDEAPGLFEQKTVHEPAPAYAANNAPDAPSAAQEQPPTIHQPEHHDRMSTRYPKRLIEVDLPIKRISAHARREKSIRHGHISTLHIWWARRPLAACRAVICAALWPDPVDVTEEDVARARKEGKALEVNTCPPRFLASAKQAMTAWAKDHLDQCSADSFPRFVEIAKDPSVLSDGIRLRIALLDFIADFANWDNSTVREYLDTSRALTQVAHESLGGAPNTRPLVVDPFAGGGSIPLEALRVGADTFASDLNPVPVLLNKVVLEYIPKYGQRLADEVRRWGDWIKQEAARELAEFYPKDADGSTPVAYLWARTIQCEGPGCETCIPMLRSSSLFSKGKKHVAIQMYPKAGDQGTMEVDIVVTDDGVSWKSQRGRDLKGGKPNLDGTVRRSSVTCPRCGYTTPAENVRNQFAARSGGANDAQLLAVVTDAQQQTARFRIAKEEESEQLVRAASRIAELNWTFNGLAPVPTEDLPYLRSIFNIHLLGVDEWGKLFNSRQLLALCTLIEKLHQYSTKQPHGGEAEFIRAIQTCMAFVIDRCADYWSSLAVWAGEFVAHTFGRQALGIVWDYAEVNGFANGSGNFSGAVDWVCRVIERLSIEQTASATVEAASAAEHPLPNDSVQAFVTDPPYYDAVPYADLSDFFYVWLRRSIGHLHPTLFRDVRAPKNAEIVQLSERNPIYAAKTREHFETQMRQAMEEGRRILAPNAIGIVVFAHKTTTGWETQLQAMIEAGWVITGSWPIDTERPGRLRANNAAALASSVHLVCRPRENPDGSLRSSDVGDWRDVLQELPRRIHEWMPRLSDEGVVGADAIFACLGPALEIFSRYSRVEKASGELVTLKEYLEHVWAAVSKEALSTIFAGASTEGFEPDARLTAMWLWTLSAPQADDRVIGEEQTDDQDEEEQPSKKAVKGGFVLEFDAARKIAQGLGAHLEGLGALVEVSGDKARLLPVSERTQTLFGKEQSAAPSSSRRKQKKTQIDLFAELTNTDDIEGIWGEKAVTKVGETTLDRVHQSMILFAAGRGEALRRFLVEDGAGKDQRFWSLAQALSALYPVGTDERRWVEGVLARKKGLGL